jgi:hypothetical protein
MAVPASIAGGDKGVPRLGDFLPDPSQGNTMKAKWDHTRVLKPGDRLFTPISDFLILLAAIGYSASLLVGGSTHTTPNPVARVSTRWPDLGFAVPLGGVLQHALTNKTPSEIHIGVITDPATLAPPLPNAKIQTAGYESTMTHAISPIFLMFFERYNVWLTDNLGDGINWPPTLNFARVVRNSVAHGAISIRNPNTPSVMWRGLTYSHADNGAKIVGTDLKFGELIALMFDCSDVLDSSGVPVL